MGNAPTGRRLPWGILEITNDLGTVSRESFLFD